MLTTPRWGFCGLILTILTISGIFFPQCAIAKEKLFEQEPFDRIILDKRNKNAELDIKPLKRPLPLHPKPNDVLVVRLVEEPQTPYEIKWRSIEKIDLYENILLNAANKLIAEEKREDAYEYLDFLERHYPRLENLEASFDNFLFEEAKYLYRQKRYEGSFAILRELQERNRNFPRLETAMGAASERLMENYWSKPDYTSIHFLLDNLETAFPKHPVVSKWHQRLQAKASGALEKAHQAADVGDFTKAAKLCQTLKVIWPELPGARQLAQLLHEKHPHITVGVSVVAVNPQPSSLNSWAGRRSGRLLYRTLTEYAGPSTEGGRYVCPVGKFTLDDLNRKFSLIIRPGIGWASGDAILTGNDVARRLLAMAEPDSSTYEALWAELLSRTTVSKVYSLEADLRRPFVRPDALLRTILVPYGTPNATDVPPLPNGPYSIASRNDLSIKYQKSSRYFATEEGMPEEIVERHYHTCNAAIQALNRGDIQVLDRINPWELKSVRNQRKLVVQRYALPLVHCLIPNMQNPLLARRSFRRALVYGIHREAILNQITGGAKIPGCRLLSGPFPAGIDFDDPLGYGYDSNIIPRPFEPRLAVALANVSLRELVEQNTRSGKADQPQVLPKLVLALPRSEIATVVCASIKRQLELIGIPIELRKMNTPLPSKIPTDVDLMYAELAVWEPIVDARPILGKDGLSGGCSPYMNQALLQLDRGSDWQQIHERLRRIHQLAFHDVAVIPLWQLTDFFAFNKNLKGIDEQPITLYQQIEHWRLRFEYPDTQ